MGPIILFDKSALESLSVDESVWLDAFFIANITPLFFVETLGDLEKETADGRSPGDVVGRMAEKTPDGGYPNVHHRTLCLAELLNGTPIKMDGRPAVGGAEEKHVDGKRALVLKETPEYAALARWRARRFLEVEREYARGWREQLSVIDLDSAYRLGRGVIEREGRPRDLSEARALAARLLEKPASRYASNALEEALPSRLGEPFVKEWRRRNGPPTKAFAPFTAHVFAVDLFFKIGLGADLISRERATNVVDLAYLYYLPFCQVFTSKDKLHRRMVPPFLRAEQEFVWAEDLKADLNRIDAYFWAFPDEEKLRGVISLADRPPDGSLVASIWERISGRAFETRPSPRRHRSMDPAAERALIGSYTKIVDAPAVADGRLTGEEADALVVQRWVPRVKGKWRMVPPGVGDRGRDGEAG